MSGGCRLQGLRKFITDSDGAIAEDWKWDTPVFTAHGKSVLALGAFKEHVKINFFKGASLDDPDKLFNAGLDAKASRAIDIQEGGKINGAALKALIQAAVALNAPQKKKK